MLYANLIGLIWCVALAQVVVMGLRPALQAIPPDMAFVASAAIYLGLVALHAVVSAVPWRAAIVMTVCLGLALLAAPGDRVATGFALRFARLGGGVSIPYRPTGQDRGVSPATACLILAAGDTWIVRLADHPDTCAWNTFRTEIRTQAAVIDADRRPDATKVRRFKREDLYDKP